MSSSPTSLNASSWLANSHGQLLTEHSYAVARLAVVMFENLGIKERSHTHPGIDNIESFKCQIFLTGLLHDLGKLDDNFQSFLKANKVSDHQNKGVGVHIEPKKGDERFSFANYPRHNEVSWALFNSVFTAKEMKGIMPDISYGIYYHHESVKRSDDNKNNVVWNVCSILKCVHGKNFTDNTDLSANVKKFLNEVLFIAPDNSDSHAQVIKELIEDLNNKSYVDRRDSALTPPLFLFDSVREINLKDKKKKESLSLDSFQVENEAKRILLRSLIVSADRKISELSAKQLNDLIQSDNYAGLCFAPVKDLVLSCAIEKMMSGFNEKKKNETRNEVQKKAAEKLAKNPNPAVLWGPAGCGKTKIALEWYHALHAENPCSPSRLFIIAPRKTICVGLYEELTKNYLPSSTIELILGDRKSQFINGKHVDLEPEVPIFSSQVVITTIDQVVAMMLSHKNIDMLLDLLNSHVVFDEFHEFFDLPGLVMLFKAVIHLKSWLNPSKTLLVSATPNDYFLKNVLGLRSMVEVETFNQENYKISMSQYKTIKGDDNKYKDENHPLYEERNPGDFVIFNTAKASQETSLAMDRSGSENVINFHSRFTPHDRDLVTQNIMDYWGKGNYGRSQFVLRASPIVQASLNVSTPYLLTEMCTAENWCQRLGRVNRFAEKIKMGEDEKVAEMVTAVPTINLENGCNDYPTLSFLSHIHSKHQAVAWVKFIQNKVGALQGATVQLPEVYGWYKKFHNSEEAKKAYHTDFLGVLKESVKVFQYNNFTPYLYAKKASSNKGEKILAKTSLRGRSVFVLPIEYNEQSGCSNWLYIPTSTGMGHEKHLISINKDELGEIDNYTTHHKDFLRNYTSFNNYPKYSPRYTTSKSIENQARFSSTPLLVSYPPGVQRLSQELSKIYVRRNGVVLGLMSYDLTKITNFTDPPHQPPLVKKSVVKKKNKPNLSKEML